MRLILVSESGAAVLCALLYLGYFSVGSLLKQCLFVYRTGSDNRCWSVDGSRLRSSVAVRSSDLLSEVRITKLEKSACMLMTLCRYSRR